jgi:hypothetical protein
MNEPSDAPLEASPDGGANADNDAGTDDRVEEQQLKEAAPATSAPAFCSATGPLGRSRDSKWWLFFALAPALLFARVRARRSGAR